jgi:homocitrate synthase NifV
MIGKHSGIHSIKAKFEEYGQQLTDQEAEDILVQVKKAAVELKRPLFDKELVFIYEDYIKAKGR